MNSLNIDKSSILNWNYDEKKIKLNLKAFEHWWICFHIFYCSSCDLKERIYRGFDIFLLFLFVVVVYIYFEKKKQILIVENIGKIASNINKKDLISFVDFLFSIGNSIL
jgi:hypothetical protein